MSPRPARWTTKSWQRGSLAQRGADHFAMSGPAEFIAVIAMFGLLVIFVVLTVMRQKIDSDEPQHLHVIWEWTRGFVQYRDIFDNHMPLFHLAFAPIVGLIGERATILYWMRFVLLPMYFVSAWCMYQIGARLFSRRVGIWAIIAIGFFSRYYSDATDFRTDNLWTPLWLLCITVLLDGALTLRRASVAGLLLGLCFAVSMKSTLLLLSLLIAAGLTLIFARKNIGKSSWLYLALGTALFLVMTVLIPVLVMIFFACQGVWRDFRYCVFDYNLLADLVYENHFKWGILISALILPMALYVSWRMVRGSPEAGISRTFILLVCVCYHLALQIFWPPISRTYPPIYLLASALCVGALMALSEQLIQNRAGIFKVLRLAPLPAWLALVEIFLCLGSRPVREDLTREQVHLLRDILALTEPMDYVLDCKGETVFRPRCFRTILERIAMKSIERGLIPDDVPERCIETHTCVVATILDRYSPATHEFIERNYLPVAENVRVAGIMLRRPGPSGHRFDFNVVIPARYEIISRNLNVTGNLDGVAYDGARFLSAGPHTFESISISEGLVLLWAQAVDRHFTLFERPASPSQRFGWHLLTHFS